LDAVAVSFVDGATVVDEVRQLTGLPVVSKIETAGGLEVLSTICSASDYVMAARGDLALAVPWVELPGAVQQIASACRDSGTPCILATQFAEGIEKFALPTRAEICDLAHWLDEGAAGVMLSYETVFGTQPIRAVRDGTAASVSSSMIQASGAVSALIKRWWHDDHH
jgi:pyruvate kinase